MSFVICPSAHTCVLVTKCCLFCNSKTIEMDIQQQVRVVIENSIVMQKDSKCRLRWKCQTTKNIFETVARCQSVSVVQVTWLNSECTFLMSLSFSCEQFGELSTDRLGNDLGKDYVLHSRLRGTSVYLNQSIIYLSTSKSVHHCCSFNAKSSLSLSQ